MTLYLSVVLLATLAALPAGHDAGEPVHGPVGIELLAILWGTTIGLALAHGFAFKVATQGFGEGRPREQAFKEALAEIAAAAVVAALASLAVLVFGPENEQRVVLFVLALIIGGVGYLVERANGRTRMASLIFGVITLFVGLVVSLFGSGGTFAIIVSTMLFGAVFGLVWAMAGYLATRGQRDFTSVSQVVATRYEVLVEHKYAEQGRQLLATMIDPRT